MKGLNMESSIRKKYVQNAIKAAIIICVSVLIGFAAELVFNFKVMRLDEGNKGVTVISMEGLYTEGFELRGGKLVMTGDAGRIRIDKSSNYVSKLGYTYSLGKDFNSAVRIYPTADAEAEGSFIDILDRNNRALTCSEVKIDNSVSYIDIIFAEDAKGIEISSISYDNAFNLSGRRMAAVITFSLIALFLIFYIRIVENRLEYAFLAVGFLTCIAMVFTFPAQKVSWDEAYHFNHSYRMGLGNDIVITPEVKYYGDDNAVATLMFPQTEAEFDGIEDYMDSSRIYDKNAEENEVVKGSFGKLSDVGHIAGALGISIARLLRMPLSVVYLFGKIFNVLLYVIVTFFAIKRAKVGKRLLTLAALMPTTLFLASVYSYDATLNAFAFLGLSYILSELAEKDRLITWKSYIIFVVSMFIVCVIKMVYAPLLLLLLALPNEKFKDKKTKYIMKYGIFILCIAVVIVMVLPMLLNPSATGDSRGGATSGSGQLQHIFGNPVGYAKILLLSIVSSTVDFTVGNGIFGTFAHYDFFPFGGYITVLTVFVALTDTPREKKLGTKLKLLMAAVVFIVVCFIWTAMYISFTPVGNPGINGVQGRYFLPVVIPLLLLFNTDRIQNNIPDRWYNLVALCAPVLITYSMVAYKAIAYCI